MISCSFDDCLVCHMKYFAKLLFKLTGLLWIVCWLIFTWLLTWRLLVSCPWSDASNLGSVSLSLSLSLFSIRGCCRGRCPMPPMVEPGGRAPCPVERRCSVVVVRPMLLPDCRTHTCLRGSHHLFIIIELLIGPRLCHIKAAHSNGSTLCFVFWSEQLVCWPGGVGVLSLVSLGHERHHR